MTVVVDLIASYAKWIYVFCAIGALLYLRAVWQAQRERRRALFTLEREMAGERAMRSFLVAGLFVVAAGALYAVQTYLVPRLPPPAQTVEAVPTSLLEAVPTASLGPPTETPTPAPPVTATVRPTRTGPVAMPTSAESPTPSPPPPPPRCPNPGARIIWPGVNTQLSGIVPIRGSAYAPDFQFYKVEIGVAPNPQSWSSISDIHRGQVSDGTLDVLNTDLLPAGNYILRLTVVDITGNYPPQNICEVPVRIVH